MPVRVGDALLKILGWHRYQISQFVRQSLVKDSVSAEKLADQRSTPSATVAPREAREAQKPSRR